MCAEVDMAGRVHGTVGSLSAVLSELIFEPDTPPTAKLPDSCLCWVDLKRTAEANRLTCRQTVDPFYVFFEQG